MDERDKLTVRVRLTCGMLLLALLAVCGFAGAGQEERAKTADVPMTQTVMSESEWSEFSSRSVQKELEEKRRAEIALLDSVLQDSGAQADTREDALRQKAEIAARMETEAQAEAVLNAMGFLGSSCVSGGRMLTVFVPEAYLEEKNAQTRLLDAVSGQTSLPAEEIKIILIKK